MSLGTAHRPPALSPSRSPASGPFILRTFARSILHCHSDSHTTPRPRCPASALPSIRPANTAAARSRRVDRPQCARRFLCGRCPPPIRLLPPKPPRASHPKHAASQPAHSIHPRTASQYPLFMISSRYRPIRDVPEPSLPPFCSFARAATGHASLFSLAASAL
jgi:hypothetical protein